MSRGVTALGASAGFSLAWFLSSVVPTPLLWYLPVARRFEFATVVTQLGMDFYGRILLACVAAIPGALVGRALGAGRTRVAFAWAVTLFLLVVALEVTILSLRHPVPLHP